MKVEMMVCQMVVETVERMVVLTVLHRVDTRV